MIYQYKDYYFEMQDSRVLLQEDEYGEFVDNCRDFIQKDKENNKEQRQELLGKKKEPAWHPSNEELEQLKTDLTQSIKDDLAQLVKEIINPN